MKKLVIFILFILILISAFLIYVAATISDNDVFLYDLKQRCSFATKQRMVSPSSYKILDSSLSSRNYWSNDRIEQYFSGSEAIRALKDDYNDPQNFYDITAIVKFSSKNKMGVDLVGYSSCEYFIANTYKPIIVDVGGIDIDGHVFSKDSLDYMFAESTLKKYTPEYSLMDKIKMLMNMEFNY
ncbi:hypothetical protein J3U21_11625 [Gilliamella sp. B2776]|uniref:hypothetical protein n=1 Tax=unclassified Gilliamella TaxID=2685620 RepID=UPI002269F492|nr:MULTISPECIES: hypothetical protein [unclassified Gilliamella]MCX8650984.1 hypothetical protein [Gilliamella sp. B2779]MCX8653782.1 hypothetical protein [Gilliamella sp. B2737]MCX8657376.1 hypothetical protein [Gilliamella sp. B2894]MCX8664909.1 hypothetical protein [Gilliamella sp. B2887]MCX8692797.1 hypothetical protein [Gilliamella sp. B2776]